LNHAGFTEYLQLEWHAPEVSCIGKGKSAKPYEFGTKVSIAVAHKPGLVLGARSYPGNPFDGHTLCDQLEQVTNLLQDIGVKPHTAVVDLGFTGVDADNPCVEIIHRRKFKKLSNQQRRWLRRRSAVEPKIGQLKDDHGLRRCWLKGETGDALHAVLCAAGFNIRWLMRAIANKGIQPLWQLFLRLQFALNWALQIAMVHVRQQHHTELPGPVSHLMRFVGEADRPKFA
jgi:IS5 family transposase